MNNAMESVVTILTAVIGVAILAVLVSRTAKTSDVISSAGKSFSGILGTALSPVTGGGGFSSMNYNSYSGGF